MSTHDRRLDRLRQIWAPPEVRDEVRVQRIARELDRDVASVRAEIDELRAKVRAARATTPEAMAAVLAEATGIDAARILDEAERIARREAA
jgi:hypothetical protein